jgi:signal peptidase I
LIYLVTEYVADITLCEGPSMSPTLQPAGEIVLLDKYTIRRYGVSDGCRGLERLRRALERQERFVTAAAAKPDHDEEFWHAPRISVSDLAPPTWQDVHQLLSTPLSVGDVVVVEHPSRRGTVCKRVVGLPGDTVLRPRAGLLVLPDGHVWLEGDNPAK